MHGYAPGMNTAWIITAFVVQMSVFAGLSHAEPSRTLPPVYKTSEVTRLQKETAELMAMSEEQVLAAVPEQSGVFFTDCPNCEMSTADAGNFSWTPVRPHEIECKDCGEVYPNNPRYPDDQVLEVHSIDSTHLYPYYQRPDGYKIYFRARTDYEARAYMATACQKLAELYWLTGDEAYARRAAIILLRFAEVYPGYALHYEYPFMDTKIAPYDSGNLSPDDIPRTSKWHCWGYMDISTELAGAFDVLRNWPPLADMADGKAISLIRDDLLSGMIDYTMAFEESYSNMSPRKWQNAIAAARVIERPEPIHEVVSRVEQFLNDQFLYDGAWMETSPSYARQTGGWMQQVGLALEGYEDPEGYRHPVTDERLDAGKVARVRAASNRALEIIDLTRFPNGQLIPVNDTWASAQPSRFADHFSKRETMAPVLVPGFGVAVMGGGEGNNQYAAYLNFTSGTYHKQRDALSIGLYAGDKELLSDIGYTHTKYRYWATSTPSHNTVVVDGQDQQYDQDHQMNRLRLWSSDGRGFHVAEAESVGVYPQTTRYRRTLIAIGENASDAYLVDVFQVHGGNQHDYILTGNADEDSTAKITDVDLQPFTGSLVNPGFAFTIPTGESEPNDPQSGLGYIQNLNQAQAGETITLDERLNSSPNIGLRTRLWPGADTTIYLGEAPSVRRSQGNDSTLDDYLMPIMVARRQGRALQSTFVAVHEPIDGPPRLADVTVTNNGQIVLIEVKHENAVDYIFVALDDQAVMQAPTAIGPIAFDGAQGFIRIENGEPTEAHLVNGSKLSIGDFVLEGGPLVSGNISATNVDRSDDRREWFEVEGPLPTIMEDSILLVQYPDGTTQGYHVDLVESQPESSRIFVREKAGFRFVGKNIELTTFPKRSIEGDDITFHFVQTYHYRQ